MVRFDLCWRLVWVFFLMVLISWNFIREEIVLDFWEFNKGVFFFDIFNSLVNNFRVDFFKDFYI